MNLKEGLRAVGYHWMRGAVSEEEVQQLKECLDEPGKAGERISNVSPLLEILRGTIFYKTLLQQYPRIRSVRMVAFQKSAAINWNLGWHQDRVICVRKCLPVDGFSSWSRKGGVWHCEPPIEILSEMIFVRINLDLTTEEKGAMQFAVGSNREGYIRADAAATIATKYPVNMATGEVGDVLLLSMLTLHRSAPSRLSDTRGALRIDFADFDLPSGLEWI